VSAEYAAAILPTAAAGDPVERLAALFDAHYDRLCRLARRLAPSADDALDLVQETFLKAARSPQSIPRGPKGEEAWLVHVLINIRRDQWRKTSARARHEEALSDSHGRNPEAAIIARNTVWQALDVLPPRRRAIVVLYELEGEAIPAIASLLGISAITVRWHLSIGRRELTKTLKPHLGDPNEKR
jgi:RNA polymerase sigma-70 factor (ECF subfamily)